MPFEELETQPKGQEPPQATLSYCHATEKSKKAGKKPRLTISIPTTICGTTKADLFKLMVGGGSDAGKLRLRGLPKNSAVAGAVKASEHAHFFRWNFGFVPMLGEDETFEGEKRPVRKIGDDIFEIDVPVSWFAPT